MAIFVSVAILSQLVSAGSEGSVCVADNLVKYGVCFWGNKEIHRWSRQFHKHSVFVDHVRHCCQFESFSFLLHSPEKGDTAKHHMHSLMKNLMKLTLKSLWNE